MARRLYYVMSGVLTNHEEKALNQRINRSGNIAVSLHNDVLIGERETIQPRVICSKGMESIGNDDITNDVKVELK